MYKDYHKEYVWDLSWNNNDPISLHFQVAEKQH